MTGKRQTNDSNGLLK